MKTSITLALLMMSFCLLITCFPAPTPSAAMTPRLNDVENFSVNITTTHTGAMARRHPQPGWLDGRWKCETTTGSPHAQNVKWCAENLEELTLTKCTQENPTGSKCTKMSVTQDAAIAICGTKGGSVMCPDAAWAATFIADKCKWGLLAGGWYEFYDNPGVQIIVYHS